MNLVIAGGGTGGHFYPALSVISEARRRKIETLYVGSSRGIERSREGEIDSERIFLEVLPLRGVGLRERIRALGSYFRSSLELGHRLKGSFATVIFGGYASVPAGSVTVLKFRPLFLHEQNSVPSMTNRTFSLFAKKVFITFNHTRRYFRGKHVVKTGLPVREELLKAGISKERARSLLEFDGPPVVIFLGGSQGAKFINSLAVEFAKRTGAGTVLISGERDFERISKLGEGIGNLKIFPFRTDIGNIYSAGDVAVCRAGAGTLTELSLYGIPAVMIPYPFAAGDHQYWNAREIEEIGGGIAIRQEEATASAVISAVDRIIKAHAEFSEGISSFAEKDASSRILEEILEVLK